MLSSERLAAETADRRDLKLVDSVLNMTQLSDTNFGFLKFYP